MVKFIRYSLTSLIQTPVSRAPPSIGSLFYADLAEIVGRTVGVAYYTFILYSEIRTNLSYGHPLIPRCLDKRGFTVHSFIMNFCP